MSAKELAASQQGPSAPFDDEEVASAVNPFTEDGILDRALPNEDLDLGIPLDKPLPAPPAAAAANLPPPAPDGIELHAIVDVRSESPQS